MAVSSRQKGTVGGNAFSVVPVTVPVGEMPIVERFKAIGELSGEARSGAGANMMGAMAAIAAALPTSLIVRLARQQTESIDFATSNVRGAPMSLYVAGAKILHNYPLGPIAGTAFNSTVLSYGGRLDVGLHVDSAAVEHPERLADLLQVSFDELISQAH